VGARAIFRTYRHVSARCYLSNMSRKCPNCDSSTGIREAIYGIPIEFPVNKEKYFLAGCTASGGKYVCINCDWGIEKDEQ